MVVRAHFRWGTENRYSRPRRTKGPQSGSLFTWLQLVNLGILVNNTHTHTHTHTHTERERDGKRMGIW